MGMGQASNLSKKGLCSAHQVVTLVDISFVNFLMTSKRLLASVMWVVSGAQIFAGNYLQVHVFDSFVPGLIPYL